VNIILVYLGKKVPKYVFLNLNLIRTQFPHNQTVLITDNENAAKKAQKYGSLSFLVPSPKEVWGLKPSHLSHDINFRQSFWYNTLARFYALLLYATEFPKNQFLHVEADVLLLPNFPIKLFSKISTSLAFPLSTIENAAASTLFIKNFESIKNLVDFAELTAKSEPFSTDMSILALYASKFPERVMLLPTAPNNRNSFTKSTNQNSFSKFTSNSDYFKGIFDANTWGQFLTGEDERNFYGIRRIYHHIPHHAIEPRKFAIEFNPSVQVKIENLTIDLFSLHIHSKEKALFDGRRSQKHLRRLISKSESGTVHQIKLLVLIKLLPNTLKKLFLRNIRND
jgi:hypothetical protein